MLELDAKDIYIGVYYDKDDQTFKIYQELAFPDIWYFPVFIVQDYSHRPWPVKEGNLLW